MNIDDLLTALRTINAAQNPDGFFSHGRIEDVSLDFDKFDTSVSGAYLIYLLPVRGRDDIQAGTTSYTCTLGFFRQDSMDSVPSDDHIDSVNPNSINREDIISEAETLMRNFMLALSEYSNSFAVRSWDYSPKYRDLSGTFTGEACIFTVETKLDLDC